ncbi:MAG TPA: hypothetical protein VHT26_14800 [Trebonia sp.]|nr:hypothetical protein [Trebonia sp.]
MARRDPATSASGANGDGYGAVLSFTADGTLTGQFSRDRRITDPRGLCLDLSGELVYLNSGDDRVLALDHDGNVALDSGRIDGLDPGGGTFGPDGRYYTGLRRHRTPDPPWAVAFAGNGQGVPRWGGTLRGDRRVVQDDRRRSNC